MKWFGQSTLSLVGLLSLRCTVLPPGELFKISKPRSHHPTPIKWVFLQHQCFFKLPKWFHCTTAALSETLSQQASVSCSSSVFTKGHLTTHEKSKANNLGKSEAKGKETSENYLISRKMRKDKSSVD